MPITVGDVFTGSVVTVIGLTVTDAVTVGEAYTFGLRFDLALSVTDLVIVTSSLAGNRQINVTDALTVGEVATLEQALKYVIDAIVVTDTPSLNLRSYVNVTDAITAGEVISADIAWQARVTDTITVGDVFVAPTLGALLVNSTDAVTVNESLSFHRTAPTNFSFYKTLTIQTGEVPSTQSHFAVLLPFIAGDPLFRTTANGGHVQNVTGFDIRPYANTNFSTPLDFELVPNSYDPAQGSFEMWVNVTAFDGAVIYLAYGNVLCDFDGTLSSTWDTNYQGVFHLANAVGGISVGVGSTGSTPIESVPAPEVGGTDLNVADSTSAAVFTPVNHGAMTGVGPIGGAATFSNVLSQYISLAAGGQHYTAMTVEAWFLVNAAGTLMAIASKGALAGNTEVALYYDGTHLAFTANNGSPVGIIGSTTVAAHTWYHAVGVYDGTTWRLYLNGAVDASPVTTAGPISTTAEYEIGATSISGTPSQFWDGGIGEVRISNITRLPDWITTEYNNQSNLTAFWLVGAEINVGSIAVTDTITVTDTPTVNLRSNATVIDAVTVGDVPTVNLRSFVNVTDAVTIVDTVSAVVVGQFKINQFEPILVTELITLNLITPAGAVAAEAVTIGDNVFISLQSYILTADGITVAESIAELVYTPSLVSPFVADAITVGEEVILERATGPVVCVPFRQNAIPTVTRRSSAKPAATPRTDIQPAECEDELIDA